MADPKNPSNQNIAYQIRRAGEQVGRYIAAGDWNGAYLAVTTLLDHYDMDYDPDEISHLVDVIEERVLSRLEQEAEIHANDLQSDFVSDSRMGYNEEGEEFNWEYERDRYYQNRRDDPDWMAEEMGNEILDYSNEDTPEALILQEIQQQAFGYEQEMAAEEAELPPLDPPPPELMDRETDPMKSLRRKYKSLKRYYW